MGAKAGVCVLLGEHPEARNTCLRVGHLQQHSRGPAGSGEVMDTSEVADVWHQGKCADFRELMPCLERVFLVPMKNCPVRISPVSDFSEKVSGFLSEIFCFVSVDSNVPDKENRLDRILGSPVCDLWERCSLRSPAALLF